MIKSICQFSQLYTWPLSPEDNSSHPSHCYPSPQNQVLVRTRIRWRAMNKTCAFIAQACHLPLQLWDKRRLLPQLHFPQMLPCCRARGRGEEVAGIAVWVNRSDFAKRARALLYRKPSNAGPCGEPQQSAGVVIAGTVQIVVCNGTDVVSGLRQKFPVAHFHGCHEFVMFALRAGAQHWSFAVLSCWPSGHKGEGWG